MNKLQEVNVQNESQRVQGTIEKSSQSQLILLKPLKMVLCSACDGDPLKFKRKNGQASVLPAWII
jgi:hypothetical protein